MKLSFRDPKRQHVDADRLSAYLDRQVAPAERGQIEAHLQACAACRSELESLRQTVALLHALPRVTPPRALTLSEAQVGIRRPQPRPAWYGGLLRGAGVIAAIALVALITTTMLRREAWIPAASVARVPPTAVARAEQPAAPTSAPQREQAAAPAPAAFLAAPTEPDAAADQAAKKAADAAPPSQPEPAVPAAAPQAAPQAEAATPAVALAPAAPPAAPTQGPVAAAPKQDPTVSAAAAGIAALTPAPSAPAAFAAAASEPVIPEAGVMALGRAAGGAGAEASLPPEVLTPEPTAPAGSIKADFPARAALTYADLKTLWVVDRGTGQRQLAQADGINTPQISSDGAWVAYRVTRDDHIELWVVPWSGGKPRLVLDERTLPKDGLAAEYSERRFQDARWIPGRALLALNITDVPAPSAPDAIPQTELWNLDIATAALRKVTDLGRAYRPFYSPDGKYFALLQYGTEAKPQGSLTVFKTDGAGARTALAFPASPAKPSYDTQIAWLPDSSGLWLALPDADAASAAPPNGATLYRVPLAGKAEVAGRVDASQVAWSPDGKRLAYLRYTSPSLETSELYLANADGSAPALYATPKAGTFVSWSPDSTQFLYQDNYVIFAGAAGQAPRELGNGVSVFDPRWVAANQFVSRHDTGTGWWLTLRDLGGAATGLLPLPREAMLDVAQW